MGYRGRLLTLPALAVCFLAAGPGSALAQPPVRQAERIAEIATLSTGQIVGQVHDEAGQPIEGVVVSALGSANAFAVSDKLGQFSLRQLSPGPYLVRAHRQGYLSVRGPIVEVRPSSRTPSSLTMHREGAASAPRLAEASLDTERANQVVQIFADLIHEQGKAGIMVTHDLRMCQFVDRVIQMMDGRVADVIDDRSRIASLAGVNPIIRLDIAGPLMPVGTVNTGLPLYSETLGMQMAGV